MATNIGSCIRIHGMRYRILGTQDVGDRVPRIILQREFDRSYWYVRGRMVNRFSRLRRIPDRENAHRDQGNPNLPNSLWR